MNKNISANNKEGFSLLNFIFLLLLLASCSVSKKINQLAELNVLRDSNFATAHTGIALYNVDENKYAYQYQSNKLFVPASNTKIFTCYAAMKYLGDSITAFQYIKDSNEYSIRFTGDPTLLHPDFKQQPVFDFLKKYSGNITVVNPNWLSKKYGNGWAWNDYDADYMPERSAIPVFGNVAHFEKKGNTVIVIPNAFKDSLYQLTDVRNNTLQIDRKENENYFELKVGRSKFLPADVPFITSNVLALSILSDSLHSDINFEEADVTKANWQNFKSQSVDTLLKITMHRSDNFFAEQTLLMVSQQLLGVMNDVKIIDTLLKTDYAALPQKPRWVDGSGLSRYDLFSPEDVVTVLHKMKQEFNWNRIVTILPTGNEGTLAGLYKNYAGKIYAKTGTLNGVVALSGFLTTNKGKQYIFSIMVNGYQSSAASIRKSIEKFITAIIEKY
jgi:D-alanyl-D-alanine carboxypeptidase/D-alanyl-D-alanine-endopeptidase (penicillin-binding protein 4)